MHFFSVFFIKNWIFYGTVICFGNSTVCTKQQRGKKTLLSLTLICYCHLVGMAKTVRGSTIYFVRPWNTATWRFGWLTVLALPPLNINLFTVLVKNAYRVCAIILSDFGCLGLQAWYSSVDCSPYPFRVEHLFALRFSLDYLGVAFTLRVSKVGDLLCAHFIHVLLLYYFLIWRFICPIPFEVVDFYCWWLSYGAWVECEIYKCVRRQSAPNELILKSTNEHCKYVSLFFGIA